MTRAQIIDGLRRALLRNEAATDALDTNDDRYERRCQAGERLARRFAWMTRSNDVFENDAWRDDHRFIQLDEERQVYLDSRSENGWDDREELMRRMYDVPSVLPALRQPPMMRIKMVRENARIKMVRALMISASWARLALRAWTMTKYTDRALRYAIVADRLHRVTVAEFQ